MICDIEANLRFQMCESAFSRKTQISNLRICVFEKNADFKSANLRFLEETQIRRFADWLGATNLRICESAFSRGNADSQICRLVGAANLRICVFSRKTQIRRFADWLGATNLRICVFSRFRRFADWLGLQVCESANW